MAHLFNSSVRTTLLGMAGLSLLLAGVSLTASPVRNKVLEEVTIRHTEGIPVLEVKLSFIFSYLGHFPIAEGKELRIRLKPVQVAPSDRQNVFLREGVSLRDGERFAVDEVVYEGDVTEGPWLTIHFTRPVHYRVLPDADYRGIKIFLDPSD